MSQFLKCNKETLENLCESRRYCQLKHKDDLMLSIADSDFQIPDGMKEDLIARINQGSMCYTFFDEKMIKSINTWYDYRFNLGYEINDGNIIFGSGVIHLMQVAIGALTKEGNGVIVQPPVYDPFYEIIRDKNRKQINNKLIYDKKLGRWSIDFANLELLMQDENNKLLLLCSPHNPVGRVWAKEELIKLVDLAVKYNVFIISDEIWQDIVFDNNHTPLFTLNEKAKNQVFVISSQAKTYNLGGAQIGYGICFNDEVIEKLKRELKANIHYASSNFLSACSLISGYTNLKNINWYNEYLKLIKSNFDKLKNVLEKATKIKVSEAAGLYLLWLDVSEVVKNEKELVQKLEENHIVCNTGRNYGEEYWYFLRVDYSVCSHVIDEIIKRFIVMFS